MAKSSTSMLSFFAVLLALVKHVAGMRAGPTQTASMVETEPWWGKDPCAQFGAEKKSWWWQSNICQCPKELPVPRNCVGGSDRSFDLLMVIKKGSNCRCEEDPCEKFGARNGRFSGDLCYCPSDGPIQTKECHGGGGSNSFFLSRASEGCRCVTEVEALEPYKIPVSASALRFCDALVEQSYEKNSAALGVVVRKALKKTSPEVCQHALTGTINETEAKEAPWAENASELSRHGRDEDGDQDGDRGYGRMRAVKEDATDPAEKALWEHALAQVCKDECDDLLKMMKSQKETTRLAKDVFQDHVPFAQACAEHVVQHVEAEVLGCCGRSCGFDGRRCLLWPFFSPQEKVEWEVECCSEMSILKNSSRELMCNSVLPDRLAKKASQYDLEEQSGTDVGKVLIGQNTSLFWTEKGAQESALGKEAKAHGGEKVNMDFLLEHKDVGEEYLRLGYFREEPFSKIFDGGASSVMEVNLQDDTTCDFGKLQQQCPKNFHNTYMKTCKKSWKVTQVSEGPDEDPEENIFHDLALHPEEGHCTESSSQSFATPEECESVTTNSFGEIFLHYFTYDTENKEKPIKCFTLGKNQCEGKDQWWTTIPLVSVQELLKKEDVNAFTELVYVKVKAD